jgi:hypothetical protein
VLVVFVWRLRKLVLRKVQTRSEVGVRVQVLTNPTESLLLLFVAQRWKLEYGLKVRVAQEAIGMYSVLYVIVDHSILSVGI